MKQQANDPVSAHRLSLHRKRSIALFMLFHSDPATPINDWSLYGILFQNMKLLDYVRKMKYNVAMRRAITQYDAMHYAVKRKK
ncbi:MAG: hypothetical protein ACI4U2_05325 [Christensenellaceae bacterium]